MKGKLLLGVGLAAGYVLGSRSGRAAYEKLKARSTELWQSKPVQDKVAAAAGVVKDKAPEVSEQLTEAARRAGTVISSAVHRDAGQPNATSGSAADKTPPTAPGLRSDPALSDREGQDRPDEGGPSPASPATNIDPDIRPY